MLDKKLLQRASGLVKLAYAPPPPAAPPMDPAAAGGMPPMDPSMMGAPPPMDPAAMGGMPPPPMDPAMAGMPPPPVDPATGMPMDPAAMGGMPPPPMDPATGMPMDPSMMGGMPPPPADPAAMGGMPVVLNIEDLKAILQEAAGGAGGASEPGSSGRVTNKQLDTRIDVLEQMLVGLMQHFGLNPPEKPAEEAVPAEGAPSDSPLDMSGMSPEAPLPPELSGFTPEAQKVASESVPTRTLWERENASKRAPVLDVLRRLQVYK